MQISKKEWPLLSLGGIKKRIDTQPDYQRPAVWSLSRSSFWSIPFCAVTTFRNSTGVKPGRVPTPTRWSMANSAFARFGNTTRVNTRFPKNPNRLMGSTFWG